MMAQATLRSLDASALEHPAALVHESPELLHLNGALEGEADRLGVRGHTERLLGSVERAPLDEEGFPLEAGGWGHIVLRASPSDPQAYMIGMIGIHVNAGGPGAQPPTGSVSRGSRRYRYAPLVDTASRAVFSEGA